MKILIFGGSGFIGRYLVKEFLEAGHEVTNFDMWNYKFDKEYKNYEYIRGNILDGINLRTLADMDYQPSHVLNLSALASIETCNLNPIDAFHINVFGNLKIIDWLSNTYKKIPKFIYASSLYAQSNKSGAYGLTKKQSEDWIKYFAKKYDFPYIILRFGTVYGVGAGNDNSIKRIITEAIETKVISYYGTGDETRNYIHVKDVARYIKEIIFTKEYDNKTLNLVGHQSMKSVDLIKMLKDILGDGYEMEVRHESHSDHYEVTPYSYQKDDSFVYVSDQYIDLGSGLLEVIEDLDEK